MHEVKTTSKVNVYSRFYGNSICLPVHSVSGALIGFSHLDVFHENQRLIILSNKLHSFMSYKQYTTLATGLTANKPLGMLREHSKIWQTFIVFSQIIDTQINESTEKQN